MSDLKLSVVRAAITREAKLLCVEIGDRIAVFSGGTGTVRVYATTDGKKLHRRSAPDGNGLRGARFIGNELWIVGEYGLLARSSDRAATWERVQTPTSECLWDVIRDAKGTMWIGGSGKLILRSQKGGKPKAVKHALKARDDRADPRIEIVPAGVFFTLFNAYWDGKRFVKPKGLKGMMSALATAPTGTIVTVGDKGAAFRSTDGGKSFKATSLGVKTNFNDVAVVAGRFVAVGSKGTIRVSADDGLTWKRFDSGTHHELWSIGSWGDGAFIGGDDGIVLKIATPNDTYWKGATDEFAPKPVVAANVSRVPFPTAEQREARFAKDFAAAVAAHDALASKLAPRHASDGNDAGILAAPDDADEYRVYADALQTKGDPRGELIVLHAEDRNKEAAAVLKKHKATLIGPLDNKGAFKLDWRWGFVQRARVQNPDGDTWFEDDAEYTDMEELFAQFLDSPSTRFLRELTIGIINFDGENDYDDVIAELGKKRLPALRTLFIGDFTSDETEISWSGLGDVSKLYAAIGNLEELTLRSGSMKLGKIVLPRLQRLAIITGGLDKKSLKAIESADLPSLESLTLYFGDDHYGCDITRKDLTTLLKSDRFPRLRSLGLCNAQFADELCGWLHTSPLVAQCTELDLSHGTLGDGGAHTLATYARALAHLERLDVSRSYLSNRGTKLLRTAFPNADVVTDHQRLRDGDEFSTRYVAVSE